MIDSGRLVRVAGAHSALVLGWRRGKGLMPCGHRASRFRPPDAFPTPVLLTMTEYLQAAAQMQEACGIPVIADVDTGFRRHE